MNMNDESVIQLEQLLKNNKILAKINLAHNQLTDNGFKQLFKYIQQDSKLYSIDFSFNKLTSVSLNFLYKFIITEKSFINELIFIGNNIKQKN